MDPLIPLTKLLTSQSQLGTALQGIRAIKSHVKALAKLYSETAEKAANISKRQKAAQSEEFQRVFLCLTEISNFQSENLKIESEKLQNYHKELKKCALAIKTAKVATCEGLKYAKNYIKLIEKSENSLIPNQISSESSERKNATGKISDFPNELQGISQLISGRIISNSEVIKKSLFFCEFLIEKERNSAFSEGKSNIPRFEFGFSREKIVISEETVQSRVNIAVKRHSAVYRTQEGFS